MEADMDDGMGEEMDDGEEMEQMDMTDENG